MHSLQDARVLRDAPINPVGRSVCGSLHSGYHAGVRDQSSVKVPLLSICSIHLRESCLIHLHHESASVRPWCFVISQFWLQYWCSRSIKPLSRYLFSECSISITPVSGYLLSECSISITPLSGYLFSQYTRTICQCNKHALAMCDMQVHQYGRGVPWSLHH